MIYTAGYQSLTLQQLISLLCGHGITLLIDVRSKPYSRHKAFNKKPLADALQAAGIAYQWAGDRLGGFSEISEDSIAALAETVRGGGTICLLCMEADPDKCHRKTQIARRLEDYGISARHITT